MKQFISLFLILFLVFPQNVYSKGRTKRLCIQLISPAIWVFKSPARIRKAFKKKCKPTCSKKDMAESIEEALLSSKTGPRSGKKYKKVALMVSVILSSWGLTAFILSSLGNDYLGLSIFVSNLVLYVTGFGIYDFGGAFKEPISSHHRKSGFGQPEEDFGPKQKRFVKDLNEVWESTNQHLSINEQMGRNTLRDYTFYTQTSAREAQRFLEQGKSDTATSQIAEILLRMRMVFPEVSPAHPVITRAVRVTLWDLGLWNQAHSQIVLDKLKKWDEDYSISDVQKYYIEGLNAWFPLEEN